MFCRPLMLVAATVLAIQAGCCVDRVYQPTSCHDTWDPVLGSCDQCGSCGSSGGGTCGTGFGSCANGCGGQSPCQSMKHSLSCGAGCGDIYWDEWLSDPPDECDPCDDCGNFVGPRCCPPRFWDQFRAGLAGWRYGNAGCCEHESEYMTSGDGEMVTEGEVIYDGPVLTPASPKAGTPKEAAPDTILKKAPTNADDAPATPAEQQPPSVPMDTTPESNLFDSEPRPTNSPRSVLEKQAAYRSANLRTPPKLLPQHHSHTKSHPHSHATAKRTQSHQHAVKRGMVR